MLGTLTDWFDRVFPPSATGAAASGGRGISSGEEHALRLATAVMLVEVMRADTSFHAGEREAVRAALREKFGLNEEEAQRLQELAEATAKEATDLFSFTTRINERFTDAQKLRMVELMWRVAYADGHLSAHERHVMWRVADLLHVPQGAYVNARARAEQAAGAPLQETVANPRAG